MRFLRVVAVATLATLLATCGESPVAPPPPPVPGVLVVRLTTPNADDAALLIRVTGPSGMTAVAAVNPAYVVRSRPETNAFNAAVFGDFTTGAALLRFTVPDISKAAEYHAAIVEVADEANAVRAATTGYALTVEQ